MIYDYTHADCYGEDEVTELRGEIADRDRVVARLLDGWAPVVNRTAPSGWIDSYDVREPEPMSDGEAAIIRQHQQEKTQ